MLTQTRDIYAVGENSPRNQSFGKEEVGLLEPRYTTPSACEDPICNKFHDWVCIYSGNRTYLFAGQYLPASHPRVLGSSYRESLCSCCIQRAHIGLISSNLVGCPLFRYLFESWKFAVVVGWLLSPMSTYKRAFVGGNSKCPDRGEWNHLIDIRSTKRTSLRCSQEAERCYLPEDLYVLKALDHVTLAIETVINLGFQCEGPC